MATTTVKKAKHNIKVTISELNQPSDEAVAEFNRIINEIARDIIVERAANKALNKAKSTP
ncbi:MAG: hypothetical protein P4L59_01260 [Desulfosporosinus sp.]|nr:hypothetical protein [Desulfosporosinus sp.]